MSFDVEKIHKSGRRVKKFLGKNSITPSPAAIHKLRTSTRSLETTFSSVGFDSKRKVRRLLSDLRDVRKSAGKVRDMDVLTSDALMLSGPRGHRTRLQDQERDCLVQLVEHLGAERKKYAKKLHLAVQRNGSQLRRQLKQNLKRLEKVLKKADTNKPVGSDVLPSTMARAIKLSSGLAFPTSLNRSNLHPYRLKIKDLRDVLQLSHQPRGEEFVGKLGEVKDAIGDWHDWDELNTIASQLLDHGMPCKLIKHLRANRDSKFERALSITSRFRANYLKSKRSTPGSHHHKPATLSEPVLRATSAIAEY